MKTNNPYSPHRVNVSLFYGRDQVLRELLADLNGGKSCAVVGGRRIGKSTLLRKLANELDSGLGRGIKNEFAVVPIYVDLLSLAPYTKVVYSSILENVIDSLARLGLIRRDHNRDILLLDDAPGEESRTFEEILIRWLELVTPRCFVRFAFLFDEVERIAASEWGGGFFSNWRYMLNNAPRVHEHLSAVFAGAKEMNQLCVDVGSPLAGVLSWRNIGLFSWPDTRKLIQEPATYLISDHLARRIFVSTGGHPFITQFLMHQMCQFDPPWTGDHVSSAENEFMKTQSQVFSNWLSKFENTDREVYSFLAASRKTEAKRTLIRLVGDLPANEALSFLCHTGVATRGKGGSETYRARGDLFLNWFLDEGCRDIVPSSFDRRIYEMLSKIDPKIATKYMTAWSIQHTRLDNYSGAIGEMRDVVTLLLHSLAPDNRVKAVPEYEPEKDGSGLHRSQPTRKQRLAYIAKTKDFTSQAIDSEMLLFEQLLANLTMIVQKAYGQASSRTHTVATHEQAWKCLKQLDSILAQIL